MKHGSTLFAKGVVYLVGLAALAVCFILLPELAREESVGKITNPYMTYAFLGGAYIVFLPFFIALYQTLTLIGYVDKNKALSHESIKTLQHIKVCTIVFIALLLIAICVGMSMAKSVDPNEDVTFMISFGFIGATIASVIVVFIAVLQKLFADAIAMKSENDLIV